MSIASDFAARHALAKSEIETADASRPISFHCATCDASVTLDGGLSIAPGTGAGNVELSIDDALLLAAWISTTFG